MSITANERVVNMVLCAREPFVPFYYIANKPDMRLIGYAETDEELHRSAVAEDTETDEADDCDKRGNLSDMRI